MTTQPLYLALDLETTGLDPERDEVLEVGWAVLDHRLDQLTPVRSMVLRLTGRGEARLEGNPVAADMHTENGLLAAARRSTRSTLDASHAIVSTLIATGALDRLGQSAAAPIILFGSSVHFDRRFLDEHLPSIARHLHYRIFDVSTVIAFMGAADADPTDYTTRGAHRAADDIAWSIAAAQGCLAVARDGQRAVGALAEAHEGVGR